VNRVDRAETAARPRGGARAIEAQIKGLGTEHLYSLDGEWERRR
jgi:hypothetical protein